MKDVSYYLSRGFDARMAAYFANGRRRIVSVSPNRDFTLSLVFDNGETRIYDCKPHLMEGTVFAPFREYENFERVYLDEFHCVSWDVDPTVDSRKQWSNKVDLSSDNCYIDSVPIQS